MFWYDHDMSGWGWFGVSAGMILFWALLVTAAVLFFRTQGRAPEHMHSHLPERPAPERLLAERFARGEVDEEEYRRALEVLRAAAGPDLTKR
jgi:putative membrane protein